MIVVLCIYNDIFAHYCRKLPVWRRVCSKRAGFILFIIQDRPTSLLLCMKSLSAFLTNTIHVKWFFFLVRKATVACHGYLTQISSLETDVDPLCTKDIFLFSLADTQDFFLSPVYHTSIWHTYIFNLYIILCAYCNVKACD